MNLEIFGGAKESRAVTQKQATRAYVSAWSNPVSPKFWLLRGKPLVIMAQAELQDKMGDRLAVTEKVVTQLRAMGGFDLCDYLPKSLQGTQVGREITLLERLDILVQAIMEMLLAGLPRHAPQSSDIISLDRIGLFRGRFDNLSSTLRNSSAAARNYSRTSRLWTL